MTRRIICVLMMLILASQVCFAQGVILNKVDEENHIPLGGVLLKEGGVKKLEEEPISLFNLNPLPFDEYIAEAVLNEEELPQVITGLEQYEIHKDDFFNAYVDAVLKHPETLLLTGYYDIATVIGTDIVGAVLPMYIVSDKAEADLARADMAAAVKEYTDLAAEYDTDLEKLLVIHDKMVADCDYDVRVLNESTAEETEPTIHHALGALRDKFAVCQGYSQALYMIAKELNIELDFCYSKQKNHMWNYVKLDGKWYHMDMTNDDPPAKDENGNTIARKDTRAWHGYFMVSDGGLRAAAHGSDYGPFVGDKPVCDSTKYEANHLFNMNSVYFTAERNVNGYFTVNVVIDGPLGTPIVIPFISRSLYTGPMVTSPTRIKVPQVVMENGIEVTKEITNLYLAQYTTRSIPEVVPYVKTSDAIAVYPVQSESTRDTFDMVPIAEDVENNPVNQFTAYFFGVGTLRPWSIAKKWVLQQN